jgi:hypothetical protein
MSADEMPFIGSDTQYHLLKWGRSMTGTEKTNVSSSVYKNNLSLYTQVSELCVCVEVRANL